MANDKPGKKFVNFINARNKRKHDKYKLDLIIQKIQYFFPLLSVDDEI